MSNKGFITLYRKFLEWEWYSDANVSRVFIHCLLKANHKERNWKGIVVERGSFITGRKKLAKELRLSEQQIRTALNKLKSTNDIEVETTNAYTKISVVNYNKYQDFDGNNNPHFQQLNNHQITNEQPTDNQRITTNNNDNNTTSRLMMIDINSICNELGFNFLNESQAEIIQNHWLEHFSINELRNIVMKAKGHNPANLFAYTNQIIYNELQNKLSKEELEKEIEIVDYKWWLEED